MRFPTDRDPIDIAQTHAEMIEPGLNRMHRKVLDMLAADESLFLDREAQDAVDHERRGGVLAGIYTQYEHRRTTPKIKPASTRSPANTGVSGCR